MSKGTAKSVNSRPQRPVGGKPLRILTAVPICDGHDSAIVSINLELAHHGIELIYLGYHRSVRDIVRAAIQEDVEAVGISSYNGGHLEFFDEVVRSLRRRTAGRIRVFGGGGGTISVADAHLMEKKGVDRIFFPGTPLAEIARWVQKNYGRPNVRRYALVHRSRLGSDLGLARTLSAVEENGALARVCRKLWAIGMRDVFHAGPNAQRLKLHTQTSGRSLIAPEFKNNLTRTAIELLLACANATNSCHSNSADEPFTTPNEEYVRLAAHGQAILLEESGLFRFMMNALGSSPGMKIVENAVEAAILDEFRTLDQLGGVLAATELRYQRSQIQASAHQYERQINENLRPIVGLNRYRNVDSKLPQVKVVRTSRATKELQIARLRRFKRRHRAHAERCLDRLSETVERGGNVFVELIKTVEHCSLGQIAGRLQEFVGRYRPSI